jgi:1,4-dihydroxy-2-naphthoyl-CoA hydrolase
VYTYQTAIRMQHTDVAGVVFFARVFDLAHLAYEEMLDAIGHPLPSDMGRAPLILPLIHAETDYRGALRLGDRVQIEVQVQEVRSRAFSLAYSFKKEDGSEAATTLTVHAAVDAATGHATALPEDLAEALRALM